MADDRKLILFIAMSLDGFIADSNENLDFLKLVEQEGQDYGYSDLLNKVDAIIIGRKTYEKVLSMGVEYSHDEKEIYIITHTKRPASGNIEFYTGELTDLVSNLKGRQGKNIFCDGGAEIVNELLKNKLIDELIISVIPILLGDGVKLFKPGQPKQPLELLSAKQFDKGLVQLHYIRAEK